MADIQIDMPKAVLDAFCAKWKISQFALYGDVLTEQFGPASTINVLLSFYPDEKWSMFDQIDMQDELQEIFNHPVHISTRRSVEKSRNPLFRASVLDSAQIVHAA